MFERGYILGGRGRFLECRTVLEKGGYMYILGERGTFWEGCTWMFKWGGGVYSGREG